MMMQPTRTMQWNMGDEDLRTGTRRYLYTIRIMPAVQAMLTMEILSSVILQDGRDSERKDIFLHSYAYTMTMFLKEVQLMDHVIKLEEFKRSLGSESWTGSR